MIHENLSKIYNNAQPIDENPLNMQPRMDVVSDSRGYVYEMQIGDHYFTRDEVSAAFGNPMMTTFHRLQYHAETQKVRTAGWQIPGEITEIHRMSFRPQDSTTSVFVTPQEIIDRVIQYRIEEELRMQDALEEILLLQMEDCIPNDDLSISLDDIILSNGEKFTDYAERVGDGENIRIEIIEQTDDEIREGLAEAERNRIAREEQKKNLDAKGLQGLLKDAFPKPNKENLVIKLLSGVGEEVLKQTRKLTPIQAKVIEAALMGAVLTNQFAFGTSAIEAPDKATVTHVANQPEVTTDTSVGQDQAQQEEMQRCMQSIAPEQMIDIRVDLFKQSEFYQERINSETYSERARVIWVQYVADAVKEAWAVDSEYFMRNGYRDMDHLFMTQIYKAYAESKGNRFKYNENNPLVAGLYHDSIDTARSIVRQQDLREKYPDLFPNRRLQRDDLINARRATIIDIYISAADFRYLSNRLDGEVNNVFSRYHPYIPHVAGGPNAFELIEAAIERPTKRDRSGNRVLQTAVDVVGRGVANDNPSLFYRTVKIYNGEEVTTAYIATLPENAARRVRDRRIPLSVDQTIEILRTRGQDQAGIESIGFSSPESTQGAIQQHCQLKAA